jgi:hypothetical protein
MTIKNPETPEGLGAAVHETLAQLRIPPGAVGDAAGLVAMSPTMDGTAPLYTLRLDRLVAGDGLAAATPTGWRTLVTGTAHGTVSADADASGAGMQVQQVSRGPAVAGLAEAVVAAQDAGAGDEVYELRMLQIPGISLTAVWLHSTEGADDLLVPAAPAPAGLEPAQALRADDLLTRIAPLAATNLAEAPATPEP